MKKYLILFLLVSFSFGHLLNGKLDKTDKEYLKQKKVLKVCINPDWAPIEFRKNGVPQGISIDILKAISKKIGLKLKFIYSNSWFESQEFLMIHKCDITPTAVKTPKRSEYAIFTRPYLTYDLAIITRVDAPYVTNLDAIIEKTITRKKGSGLIPKLKSLYPNVKLLTPDTYKEMFELVEDKKAYATIATLPVFSYYKKKYNLTKLKIAGFTGWTYPLRIMVNKHEPKLRDILDAELKFISPKVTQSIYEKWIIQTKPEINYKHIFIMLAIVFFIIVVSTIWIYLLKQKNKELDKLSKVKSQFLSNMSHELRTPLNALLGFVQILQKDTKECKKYLPIIDSAAKTIVSEIDDILNFDRLQSKIDIKEVDFHSKELKNSFLYFKLEAEKKGLVCNLEFDLPRYLYGDIDKIRDILIHLLDNAIKFTKEGEIKLTLKYKDNKLFVSVKDTGVGIPKYQIDEIFKEFTQLDNRVNKEYDGIGIGLTIAKKLVETLGGDLKVKSTLNKGSEFYFDIPIKESKKDKSVIDIKDKVLVVEDNKANQMFMQVVLKQLKIKFDLAEHGKVAIDMYKEHQYSIILMDINMPIMDGIEATKKIREYEKENGLEPSKILAVTANAIDGDEEKFLAVGMDGYIPKPVDIEKLKKALSL